MLLIKDGKNQNKFSEDLEDVCMICNEFTICVLAVRNELSFS